MLGVAEVDQGIKARNGFENDIAALAAIAAIGPAIFDIHLAPETDSTSAARAGADKDFGLIEKMHGGLLTGYEANVAQGVWRCDKPDMSGAWVLLFEL
jgi:hypothetical protein